MSESAKDRLAKLKLLLAKERATENNQLYINDLEASIKILEKRQPTYEVVT